MTVVFISWSKEKSKALAQALREWLPHVLQTIEPWMSEFDIDVGDHWESAIDEALGRAQFAIVCLTETNHQSPWVNYEVGFLSKTLARSICAYLIGVQKKDISEFPINRYQATTADKQGTLGLLKAINKKSARPVSDNVLARSFEHFWPELEQTMKNLPDEEKLEDAKQLLGFRDLSQRRLQLPESDLFTLSVINPLSHSRKGHAVTEWQPIDEATQISKDWLLVQDEAGNPVPAQVDLIDPEDPSSATLVFSLNREMSPSLSDGSPSQTFVTVEKGKQLRSAPDESNASDEPRCEFLEQERRVKLISNRMEVWLELNPAPWDPEKDWYAGSVSSVWLDKLEMLDAYKDAIRITDYERRCMLINRLQIQPRDRKAELYEQPELIKEPYELVSRSSGPVRASVTILSQPVHCGFWELPDQKEFPVKCRLRRVISLYRDANYIFEELKIIPVSDKRIDDKDIESIRFTIRYFSYIDFGSETYRTDNKIKWFTVGTTWPPRQGYGFASDSRAGKKVKYPHPNYPKKGDEENTFSWDLTTSHSAKCLHLFRRGDPDDLQAEIEKAWIEQIRKPLIVKIPERPKDSGYKRL